MRTALWVPSGSREDLAVVAAVADANRWQVAAVIHRWEDWVALVLEDAVDVGIITGRHILPSDRTPRLLTVEEALPRRRRRPRRLR